MNRQRAVVFWVMLAAAATAPLFGLAQTINPPPSGEFATKDILTIVISALAFAISTGTAIFNWWSWKKKNLEDAKKALTEAIVGMITARQKLEEFKVSSAEKYGGIALLPYRIALTDQRHLYLSKALQLLSVHDQQLDPSYFEYMMLAANLIDLGRTADSVKFYEKSLAIAKADNNAVAVAATRRVYGRAQIAAGEHDPGRAEMLEAACDYEALATRHAYDRDRMFEEAAETYRRLIWVEIQAEHTKTLAKDIDAMERLVNKVRDPVRLRALTGGLNELRATINGPASTTTEHSPTTNAEPNADHTQGLRGHGASPGSAL